MTDRKEDPTDELKEDPPLFATAANIGTVALGASATIYVIFEIIVCGCP